MSFASGPGKFLMVLITCEVSYVTSSGSCFTPGGCSQGAGYPLYSLLGAIQVFVPVFPGLLPHVVIIQIVC